MGCKRFLFSQRGRLLPTKIIYAGDAATNQVSLSKRLQRSISGKNFIKDSTSLSWAGGGAVEIKLEIVLYDTKRRLNVQRKDIPRDDNLCMLHFRRW
jgi:hypothetical protein